MKMVIIGSGPAAIAAVRAIRNYDNKCEITVISEQDRVYSACLLPGFIAGEIPAERLFYCGKDFWREMRVTKITGCAAELNKSEKVIILSNGVLIGYDKLLIATGAKAKEPQQRDDRLFCLRTLSDAIDIDQAVPSASEAMVIGAGCVGIETALALLKRGLKVTLIESENRILPNILDKETSDFVMGRLIKLGMNVRLNCFLRNNALEQEINLSKNGKTICIMAVGIVQNTELALSGGIGCRQHIIVDNQMKTNVQDVFAAGDVTASSDTAIWPHAVGQGATAGLNMMGMNKSIQPAVRCNMIDIAGLSVFSAGTFPDGAEVLKGKNRTLWIENDTICGIVEIGQSSKSGVFLNMLNKKVNINPVREKVLKTSFGYASLRTGL